MTCLLLSMNVQAQGVSKTVHVETAGTLPVLIAESEKYQITDLTLTGDLNGTDIRYIREMAGSTNGKLAVLNLVDANIVSGGDYYYHSSSYSYCYTKNDTISDYMFYGCNSLTNVTIGNSVTSIGRNAFSNSGLTEFDVSEQNAVFADIDGVLCNKSKTAIVRYPEAKVANYMIYLTALLRLKIAHFILAGT
jgi:hypothetical protein